MSVSGPVPLIWRNGRVFGNFTIAAGSRLNFSGDFYPWLSSGMDTNPAIMTNLGTVVWAGGTPFYGASSAQVHNFGEWRVEAGGTALEYSGGGAAMTFRNLGRFVKEGTETTVIGNVAFDNSGRILASAGQLTFNIPPANTGEFYFPLRGLRPGTDYGVIRVQGAWPLQGTLRAETTNGFALAQGQNFDVVTGNNLFGNFTAAQLPALPPDLGWTTDYFPTLTRLRITDACLAEGLVGWWPGDGGAGDVTGAHNGTLMNGAQFAVGRVNQAFSFDGVDDYVNLGNWNAGTRWTLQAWVKLNQIQSGRRAVLGGMAESREWALSVTDGYLGVAYRPTGASTATLTNAARAETNVWYHLSGTCNGSNVAFYVNGVLIGTAPSDPEYSGTANGIRMGGSVCCGEYFAGQVDEATIHNRPLAQSEIATTFSQGAAGRCAGLGLGILAFTPGGLVASNVSQFTIRFNQPFRTNTFTSADLVLTGPGGAIPTAGFSIAPNASFDGRTFAVNLPPLSQEGVYVVTIGPNIQTTSGQLMAAPFTASFTIDKTGPHVTAFSPTSPASNEVASIQATFSEAISAASVQPGDLTITGANAPSVLSVTALASNIFRFNLSRGLNQGSNSITIGPAITDLAGNLMNQNGNTINGEPGDAFTTFISVETPDLAVHALTAPSLALAGQAANLIFTVTNSGTATALGGWRADFRLALTPSGSNATFLGSASVTNAILPGAFLTLTQGLVLPQGVAGTRYFGVVLDSLDQVLENNETNNVAWAPNGTGVSAPDLTVSNLVVAGSATLGGTTSVRWLRANIGSAATFVAGEDRIFLSAVSNSITGARQLVVVPGAVMAAGSSLTRTQIVSIPLETTLPAGNYFIVVAVDSPDAQPESDEGNNLASAAVRLNQPPLPDLAVVNLVTPLRFFPDAPQPVRWTVMNSGTLGLTNRVWRERISFSNALAGLVTLAEFDRSDTLPAGSFVERTEEVTFSTAWPPEPGFLFLTVDYFDAVVELTEANNVLRSDGAIPVTASLQLTFSPATLFEGSNVVTATLTRNGSTALPLHVTLSNNLPARLLMSNSVTIAAGASSAAFTIAAPWNGTVDGTVNVQIGATASNVLSAVKTLPLVDSSAPTLTLLLATNRLREGLSMPVTVSRGSAATQELVVLIGAFDPSSLTTPFSVTIPSNQVSVGFAVLAPDDTLFNGSRSNFVRAGAAGYEGATASLTVLDDDLPDVTLELSPAIVPENAGPQGANLTVRLSAPAVRNVVLDLVSSDPARARVPVSVSIPAGQIAASASVEIIDNLQFGSNAPVQFQGFLHESGSTRHLAQTAIVTLQIRDDEGPSLALTLDRTLVNEGLSPATGARVARNGSTGGALVVQLSSSDTTEATVPASVTIPAGQLGTSFNVNSVQDNITDGAQRVTITASAAGYTAGSAELTVSDQDLPDLRLVSITGPTNAVAESPFTVTYRVENQGRVATASNLLTKIYLRTDPLAFGGIVVGTYTLAESVATRAVLPAKPARALRQHTRALLSRGGYGCGWAESRDARRQQCADQRSD